MNTSFNINMVMDSEVLYTHEISRRSVARAALHLGIDGMSQDSLDILADILQHFLSRIGKTISHLVEASGRPSSHANTLDALNAISLNTLSAKSNPLLPVATLPVENDLEISSSSTTQASWQDLAIFLFGPKWESPCEHSAVGAAGRGKLGPSSQQNSSQEGWRAPLMEEIPNFPLASQRVANPHRLSDHVAASLHLDGDDDNGINREDKQIQLLDEIPDSVFTEWGGLGIKPLLNKRSMDNKHENANKEENKTTPAFSQDSTADDKIESEDAPPKKRVKIMLEESEEKSNNENQGSESNNHPYLASFMPDFPRSFRSARSVVEIKVPNKKKNTNTLATKVPENGAVGAVRTSLVELGQKAYYWGSGWDATTTSTAAAPKVPIGMNSAPEAPTPVIAPLGRASHSRVSRILEGSMDTVH
jgi:hypothetical protein